MTKKSESTGWASTVAIAGAAAIGSAAITAALLYANSRRNRDDKPRRPQDAPETD